MSECFHSKNWIYDPSKLFTIFAICKVAYGIANPGTIYECSFSSGSIAAAQMVVSNREVGRHIINRNLTGNHCSYMNMGWFTFRKAKRRKANSIDPAGSQHWISNNQCFSLSDRARQIVLDKDIEFKRILVFTISWHKAFSALSK